MPPLRIPFEAHLESCDWTGELHQALLRHAPETWLGAQLGFAPMFLAVGGPDAALSQTGYAPACDGVRVLFSYRRLPPGAVLLDHETWHTVLAAVTCHGDRHGVVELDEGVRRALFKSSLTVTDWMARARATPGSVQAAVGELDLRSADRVACYDDDVRGQLVRLGFPPQRVRVLRPPAWEPVRTAGAGPAA